tara:strand:- start:620 stop:1696 length:1077 start_codon:yes stop_codon:yes gene_type:complete
MINHKLLKVAILGCGRVAQHYNKIIKYENFEEIEVIAVCDIDQKKADDFSKFWNCEKYSDYEKMLKEKKPDIVLILTYSGLHFEHAKTALESGVHVLVEKPITLFPNEADYLINLSKSKNLILEVAFQNRLNPSIDMLRKTIQNKRLGKIISANIRLRWCRYQDYYEDDWHGSWINDGGVTNQQAIHHIDALDMLLGPINSLSAITTKRLNDLEAEDTMVAAIKFNSGALGTLEATTAARPKDYEASLSIVGEKGIVVIGGIALNQIETWDFIESSEEDAEIPKKFSQEVPNGYGLSHGPLLRNFFKRVASDYKSDFNSLIQAKNTTKIVHAIYQSDELKKWIHLSDDPISTRLGKKE